MHPQLINMNLQKKVWSLWVYKKVIYKVRKTQHWNLEFGHKQGEIQKTKKKID
jgi:hypothetical protein